MALPVTTLSIPRLFMPLFFISPLRILNSFLYEVGWVKIYWHLPLVLCGILGHAVWNSYFGLISEEN